MAIFSPVFNGYTLSQVADPTLTEPSPELTGRITAAGPGSDCRRGLQGPRHLSPTVAAAR